MTAEETRAIREALRALGVDRLVLAVHDASFPADADEDPGRGSPYTKGASRFCEWLASSGFDGIQLGPQGLLRRGSASPYEGTLFSRNPMNLSLRSLVEEGHLPARVAEAIVAGRPEGSLERARHTEAFDAFETVLDAVHTCWMRAPDGLSTALGGFARENAWWLSKDALFDALCRVHGSDWPGNWSAGTATSSEARIDHRLLSPSPDEEVAATERISRLRAEHGEWLERYALGQLLVHRQHATFRARARGLGLSLYGDLQVGPSTRDEWAWSGLFLQGYRMGAPPSRTNPAGQPWGYPVLDPSRYGAEVASFVSARVAKLYAEMDGIRVDHPHGWVCPWVYRTDEERFRLEPEWAVQQGARLFAAPELVDHPRLAAFALVRPDQLDRALPRYADGWVSHLEPEQVDRYATLFDLLVDARPASGLVCEVLSTLPNPLAKVLERHGLGRFRVLQKAKLDDPRDVYRSENAGPSDWVMLGNHDTPPIWCVVERWKETGELSRRVDDLVGRLAPEGTSRERLAQRLSGDSGALVQALFADALACPARNVQLFFGDLFGLEEPFNTPGTVSEHNWSLRVPHDFEAFHERGRKRLRVVDLPSALLLASNAPGQHVPRELRAVLEQLSRA